jgi:hypothetical protein
VANFKLLSDFFFCLFMMLPIKKKNAGIPEYRRICYSGIVIFTVSPQSQSGIGIPAPTSVRFRWSRIIPVVPSYGFSPGFLQEAGLFVEQALPVFFDGNSTTLEQHHTVLYPLRVFAISFFLS